MKGDPSQSVSRNFMETGQSSEDLKDISIPDGAEFVTIYMMADSEDTAVHMSTTLVRERLVACANVEAGTRSVYEYDGMIQLENEVTVFMKTTAARAPEVVARLRELHSYEIPCVTVLPILGGNPGYLGWVRDQVTDLIETTDSSGQEAGAVSSSGDGAGGTGASSASSQYVPKSADFGDDYHH